MSRTKIVWAELHAPLFLAGSNLGMKLGEKGTKAPTLMEYDEKKRHLYVTYNSKTARIPETSVLSMVEADEPDTLSKSHRDLAAVKLPSAQGAQVSTPQSHVFAGLGGGVTGVGENVK